MSISFDASTWLRSRRGILLAYNSALLLALPIHSSQAASTESLSLSNALQRAIQQNPALKVFSFRQQSLQSQRQSVGLKPGYRLDLEAENFAGSGSFNGIDQTEFSLSLSSSIELGDKRSARTELSNSGLALLEARRQVAALSLLGDVTRRYINVVAVQKRIELAQSNLSLAQSTSKEVQKRARAGATPEAEVKRAQAVVAKARLTLLSEQQQLKYAKTSLSALWGSQQADFSIANGDLYQLDKDIEFATLYQRLLSNPAVQVFAEQSRVKAAELRLAKTQASMDLDWSVGVRQFQASDDSALIAGFSLPLFNSKRNRSAVSQASAAQAIVAAEKQVALLELHAQLFRAYNNRQQAIITVQHLQQEIIPALQSALSQTQQAYQRGRYSYLDYVSAKQELVSAQRSLIQAGAAALRYRADIEQLTAQPLSAALATDSQE